MKIVGRALREPFAGRAWREAVYCLLGLPLAVLGLAAVLVTCFVCVVGVLSTGVLLPLLPLALAANRGLGAAHRALARVLLHWTTPTPPRPRHPGGLAGLVNRLTDAASWRSVGYLALRFPLGAVQFALGFVWWVYSVSFLLYPLLWQLQGRPRGDATLQFAGLSLDTWPRALLVRAAGAVLLLAWPWVARGPLAVDRQLMLRLLGPSATSSAWPTSPRPASTPSTRPPPPCAASSGTCTTARRPGWWPSG
ncbi:sensor domain-containing protein [Streptacidiphilus monticola]